MNPIIKYVAIAGILLLGACGSSNNENNENNGGGVFSSRTFTVPQNFTTRLLNTTSNGVISRDDQVDSIGRDYLKSISFDIPNDATFSTYTLVGENNRNGLTSQDGIFIISLYDYDIVESKIVVEESNVFVGILNTTNTGAPLTANATFSGNYAAYLSDKNSLDLYERGSISVMVDFNEKTVTAIDSNLEINGKFSTDDNTLSGSVTYQHPLVSDNTLTAPLTGLIGVNGAIGVFSNYENTGDGEGYALGGGFVVD